MVRDQRQFGSIVPGIFTPVLAKHSKLFSLVDSIAIVLSECSETSSRCESRWKHGREVNWRTSPPSGHLRGVRRGQTRSPPSTLPAACMTSSSQVTKNSGRERSGIFPMRSPRPFKGQDPVQQFKATAKWGNSWSRFSQSFQPAGRCRSAAYSQFAQLLLTINSGLMRDVTINFGWSRS